MKKLLKKEGLRQFFNGLTRKYKIIAPVKKKDIHVFEKVSSFDEIDLNFINTAYPVKSFFLPVYQELFSFNGGKINVKTDNSKKVVFGIRPCDVNALLVIDRIFLDEYEDPYYKARRNNTIIIALSCTETGENCFCESFGTNKLTKGFDLLLTKTKQGYVVETGSEKGKQLVNSKFFSNTNIEPKIELKFKKQITENDLNKLKQNFENPIWEEEAKKCLSCTACTSTCPTCPCFFVRDETNLDLKSGHKYRYWASCQLKNFSKVAGDAFFRKERSKRLKHRIFHQLVYYKDKFNSQMCVGCGRCFTNCPTKIDMVEILGKIK